MTTVDPKAPARSALPIPRWLGVLGVAERNVVSHRKLWLVFLVTFLEPVLYLFSLGLGLGTLVGDLDVGDSSISYARFVAPALMATAAMNGAFFDMTFNFFYKLKYAKTFDAMLNTPVSMAEILLGEIAWAVTRGTIYATGFLGVMVLMGLTSSWWSVLAIPASLFVGLAFAALGATFSSFIRTWHDFDLIQLVLQPLFLCSTTFFPLEVYPSWAQPLVRLSPLYHGVALLRDLSLGTVGLSDVGHLGVLAALGVVGALIARRRLAELLLK
jgi:lipooligosaccharide transport system permease protein